VPRTSAAALATVPIAPSAALRPRLAVPAGLSAAERAVWASTVAAAPPGLLAADSAPLLARYCAHVVRARCIEVAIAGCDIADPVGVRAYLDLAKAARAESSAIVALARSLRLSPHTRTHAVTAARRASAHQPRAGIEALFDGGEP
jgi:hypothetical protein